MVTSTLLVALSACSLSDPAGTDAAGAIIGRLTRSPSCPDQRALEPCSVQAVAGALVVATGKHGHGETRTSERGRFRLSLPPGCYLLIARNSGGYASTASATACVGGPPLTLVVDSGIR